MGLSLKKITKKIVNTVEGAGKAVVNQGEAGVKSVYDIGRGAAASVTHNPVALANANAAKAKDEPAFLAPITRPFAQAAETVVHPFSQHTVTPQSDTDKRIFGSTPIQNIQAGVATNYDQHHNLLLAGAYGAGQVAQDALAIAGAKGTIGKVGEIATPALRTGAVTLKKAGDELGQAGAATIKEDGSVVPTAKKAVAKLKTQPAVSDKEAQSYANVFGISKEDATKEIQANKEPLTPVTPIKNEDLGSVAPPKTPRPVNQRTPQENTDANPVKVDIAQVNKGDYEKVRTNIQQATSPIQNLGKNAAYSASKLSDRDKSRFNIDYIEHPETIKTADNPKLVRRAVAQFKQLSDTVHATSQAVGGNTTYMKNYALHDYDLSRPEDVDRMQQFINSRGGVVSADNFSGVDSQSRIFRDLREAKSHGFNESTAPLEERIMNYANASGSKLRRQALVKGIQEADDGPQVRSIDLKNSQTIPISEEGYKQFKSLTDNADPGAVLKAYRSANAGVKRVLLGLSLFHTNNIVALQAFPTLIARGDIGGAFKGLADSYATIFSPKYSNFLQHQAQMDGTFQAAAKMGTPIAFGSDVSTTGKIELGSALGEKAIFERSLPAMHIRLVQNVVRDLQRRNISLDSVEARQFGKQIDQIMGYVNKEVRNFNPKVSRGLGDILLAPQFTRTKWETLRDAFKPGAPNTLARQAVVGKLAMEAIITLGAGAIVNQNTDNLKDSLIRTLIHPSVSTPYKDSKGNNIELRLPSNYISEAAGLATNLKRGKDGRLSVTARPDQLGGNLENYGQARLASIPAAVLKGVTNENYAGKPLSDPNAPAGKRAIQAATTIGQDELPIGLQGAVDTKAVKDRLPASSREIINANQPGTNSLLKSSLSAVGLTPGTDKTTGKGLQNNQYYEALDDAKKGLNRQEADALDIISGSKKNPVTGQYDIKKSVYDSPTKAGLLLQNPKTLQALNTLNARLKAEGQKVDPLYSLPKGEQTALLQRSMLIPGSAEEKQWNVNNASWYKDFSKQRSAFFDSLPAGDPNAPKDPIPYPSFSTSTENDMNKYSSITDSTEKAAFLDSHPDVTDAFNKQALYTNALRTARGAPALKGYPEADTQTESLLKTMDALPSSSKSAFIRNHPSVQDYFTKVALYGVESEASTDVFQGNSPSQKELKDLYSVGKYDITKNKDGTYTLNDDTASTGSGSSGFSYGGYSDDYNPFENPEKFRVASKLKAGSKTTIRLKSGVSSGQHYSVKGGAPRRAKVTLKKSKV